MREAIRYPETSSGQVFENARDILSKSKIEDNIYLDDKYVKSAFGVAYLGVLKAIDEYLLKKGLTKKEMPKSVDAYREALNKHFAIRNGKLMREFEVIYHELHIAGYYRGDLLYVDTVKSAFKLAKSFIDKVK